MENHKMMKISFIIPAYNAAGTIIRCLDSIYQLPLSINEYEVFVVDDHSTDNTTSIVQSYIEVKPNLFLLVQDKNMRQGAARNRGVQNAHGLYIYYVDADDEVTLGLVDALDYAIANHLDVCYCDVELQLENGTFVPMRFNIPSPLLLSGDDLGEKYTDEICTGPWTYLWRREHINKVNYPFVENLRIEDADYVDHNIILADRVGHLDTIIYRYFFTPNSTVNTCNYDTISDWILAAYRRMCFHDKIRLEHPIFTQKRDFQCRCWIQSCLSLRRLTRVKIGQMPKFFRKLGRETLTYLYAKGGWGRWQRLCFSHPTIVILIVTLCSPFIHIGRYLVQYIRKIKNNLKTHA